MFWIDYSVQRTTKDSKTKSTHFEQNLYPIRFGGQRLDELWSIEDLISELPCLEEHI